MNTERFLKGVIAGFIATLVIAVLMTFQAGIGLMPELDMIGTLTQMMGSPSRIIGWFTHFFLGAVLWGGLFSAIEGWLPGRQRWLKGLAFGVGAWLLMMLAVMPITGHGLFAIEAGPKMQLLSLVFHLIFGGVLGATYGLEQPAIASRSMGGKALS